MDALEKLNKQQAQQALRVVDGTGLTVEQLIRRALFNPAIVEKIGANEGL